MRRNALLFIPIALAQLAFAAWMILGHERVLTEGDVFKFRTAPIDPRDPFRGEYVVLNFEAESGEWEYSWADEEQGRISAFARLGTDSLGFARITALMREAPLDGSYLSVTFYNYDYEGIGPRVGRVTLPFDRFYMEEGEGQRTEAMMRPEWSEGEIIQPQEAYALVRVLDGEAVIEDLIIGGRSIRLWMQEDVVTDPPQ